MRRGSNGLGIDTRSEAGLFAVRHRYDIRLLGLGEFSDGLHGRELHFLGDRRGAHVKGTAENEWETQHVVHLVRIIRAAGGDDGMSRTAFTSGRISGVGLASARINGFFAIRLTMSWVNTPAADRPRKMSASSMMSLSVRAVVLRA